MPKWMSTIDQFGAGKSAGLGVAAVVGQPEEPGAHLGRHGRCRPERSERGPGGRRRGRVRGDRSATVAGPVVLYLVMGERAAHVLNDVRQWMADNNATIMFVLFLVLGAKMLGDGIGGL